MAGGLDATRRLIVGVVGEVIHTNMGWVVMVGSVCCIRYLWPLNVVAERSGLVEGRHCAGKLKVGRIM